MVEENSFIRMEVIMKDNGEKIKWMDGENCIIKAEGWHMKAIGHKISFTGLEKYITTIQFNYLKDLIIRILIYYKIIGNFIKVC